MYIVSRKSIILMEMGMKIGPRNRVRGLDFWLLCFGGTSRCFGGGFFVFFSVVFSPFFEGSRWFFVFFQSVGDSVVFCGNFGGGGPCF